MKGLSWVKVSVSNTIVCRWAMPALTRKYALQFKSANVIVVPVDCQAMKALGHSMHQIVDSSPDEDVQSGGKTTIGDFVCTCQHKNNVRVCDNMGAN